MHSNKFHDKIIIANNFIWENMLECKSRCLGPLNNWQITVAESRIQDSILAIRQTRGIGIRNWMRTFW